MIPIRHKPTDRLEIVLGIRPAQKDLPFSGLDALYTHILAGVEDIDHVLEILSAVLFGSLVAWMHSPEIEEFLSFQPGDVELYLADLHSLVMHGPNQSVSHHPLFFNRLPCGPHTFENILDQPPSWTRGACSPVSPDYSTQW